ncbi:MAG: ABC transporter permease [Saprospiraceae bacterium]
MKKLWILIRKEFAQIFRQPTILRMIIMMPILQLILIPLAADYEVKNINLQVMDFDHSTYSVDLIQKLSASPYFQLVGLPDHPSDAMTQIELNKADLTLTIPLHFEKDLIRENKSTLSIEADAVNGQKASLGVAYAMQIIGDYNREVREKWLQLPRLNEFPQIEVRSSLWYNPFIKYPLFMVPGILALLVTMVGGLMSALNIVSEKEIGTIEQLNVSPIKKYQFLLGKLVPFWVLGLVSITLGLLVARFIYGIIPLGSYFTIYFFSAIYLIGALGVGLLLSTFADTQMQVTLISFFIIMFFVLMGGLYTPIESMPGWAQNLAAFNPVSYFIRVLRFIVIKGSGIKDLLPDLKAMIIFGIVLNVLAVLNYRKRSG